MVISCTSFYPSFWADLIIAILGGILSLTAGYLVYIGSLKKTRIDRLKYISALANQITLSAIRQGDFCIAHASALQKSPFAENYLQLEANRDTKRLADKVDQEGVYHAYLSKYGRNRETYLSFQTIYAHIDYLDALLDEMLKINKRITMFTWERKKECQLLYRKIRETVQVLSLIPEIANAQQALVEYALNLLDMPEPKGENLVPSYENVVVPMRLHIVQHAKPHPKITELLFLIDEMGNSYRGIELASKHNADDYEILGNNLKSAAEKLMNSSAKIRTDFSFEKEV